MDKLKLEYELFDSGWASMNFAAPYGEYEASISYLHNSLDQLADMALDLKKGLKESKAAFATEPGEVQFIVKILEGRAAYEIRQFRDYESREGIRVNQSELILKGLTSPTRVIQQITTILWKVYEHIGPQEYKKRWKAHDFPTDKYKALITTESTSPRTSAYET